MKKKDWEKRYEVGFNAILYRERKDSHEDKLNWVKAFSMDFIQQEIDRAREEEIEEIVSELECWKVHWIDTTKDNGAEYLRDALVKLLKSNLIK